MPDAPPPEGSTPGTGQSLTRLLLQQVLGLVFPDPEKALQDSLERNENANRLMRLATVRHQDHIYAQEELEFRQGYIDGRSIVFPNNPLPDQPKQQTAAEEGDEDMPKDMVGGDNLENVNITITIPGGELTTGEDSPPTSAPPEPPPVIAQPQTTPQTVVANKVSTGRVLPAALLGASILGASLPIGYGLSKIKLDVPKPGPVPVNLFELKPDRDPPPRVD